MTLLGTVVAGRAMCAFYNEGKSFCFVFIEEPN